MWKKNIADKKKAHSEISFFFFFRWSQTLTIAAKHKLLFIQQLPSLTPRKESAANSVSFSQKFWKRIPRAHLCWGWSQSCSQQLVYWRSHLSLCMSTRMFGVSSYKAASIIFFLQGSNRSGFPVRGIKMKTLYHEASGQTKFLF